MVQNHPKIYIQTLQAKQYNHNFLHLEPSSYVKRRKKLFF